MQAYETRCMKRCLMVAVGPSPVASKRAPAVSKTGDVDDGGCNSGSGKDEVCEMSWVS